MKQNRITNEQDLNVSPTCGKPLVMGSTVFNEDCMTVMARYPDKYFDLAIVDPPYSLNIENSGTMFKKFGETKGWDANPPTSDYWQELQRVSKNQIVWGGNYFIEKLKNTKCIIWWDKMNGTNMMADGEMAWTSFDKHSKRFQMHHFSSGYDNKIHPCQKPTKLYEWCLQNFAEQGQSILDTHVGSGSSRIAANKNGFEFVGAEIDKDYFEAQEARFKDFTSQLRLFG